MREITFEGGPFTGWSMELQDRAGAVEVAYQLPITHPTMIGRDLIGPDSDGYDAVATALADGGADAMERALVWLLDSLAERLNDPRNVVVDMPARRRFDPFAERERAAVEGVTYLSRERFNHLSMIVAFGRLVRGLDVAPAVAARLVNVYDADNECRACGAHFAEPHDPGCPLDDDE